MSHQPFLPHWPWRASSAGWPDAVITTFPSQKVQSSVPHFSLLPKPNPHNSYCLSLSVCVVLSAPPPSNFFFWKNSHFSLASPGGILRLTYINIPGDSNRPFSAELHGWKPRAILLTGNTEVTGATAAFTGGS